MLKIGQKPIHSDIDSSLTGVWVVGYGDVWSDE